MTPSRKDVLKCDANHQSPFILAPLHRSTQNIFFLQNLALRRNEQQILRRKLRKKTWRCPPFIIQSSRVFPVKTHYFLPSNISLCIPQPAHTFKAGLKYTAARHSLPIFHTSYHTSFTSFPHTAVRFFNNTRKRYSKVFCRPLIFPRMFFLAISLLNIALLPDNNRSSYEKSLSSSFVFFFFFFRYPPR